MFRFLVTCIALSACSAHAEIDLESSKMAARQGDSTAQMCLAKMYADVERVAEDESKALYWFRKAAEQGDALAQFNLVSS